MEDEASRAQPKAAQPPMSAVLPDEDDEDADEDAPARKSDASKDSKGKKKKKKKQRRRHQKVEQQSITSFQNDDEEEAVEIECVNPTHRLCKSHYKYLLMSCLFHSRYVQEDIELTRTDPYYREFSKIFQAFKVCRKKINIALILCKMLQHFSVFQLADPEKEKEEMKKEIPVENAKEKATKAFTEHSSDEDSDKEDVSCSNVSFTSIQNASASAVIEVKFALQKKPKEEEEKKMSKRKLKKLNRLSVAELKQVR